MKSKKKPLTASKAKRSNPDMGKFENRNQIKLQTMVFVKARALRETNKALKKEIQDRKKIEVKLKELEKTKNEFVSVASHEFRTPLTIVNGYLSLLLNGDLGSFKDPQGEKNLYLILNKVFKETQRLNKLAEELLSVSRIESRKIKLRLSRIFVDEMISEVLSEFASVAEEKKIALKIKKPDTAATALAVQADEDKLKQVLLNLIDNAIKFTPSDGEVVIKSFCKDDQVVTQIQDNGVGIPSTIIPRIFEKFQQGNNPFVKENKGVGLGLFIVRSLVEMQHGKVWVRSKLGQGSTFSFSLPLRHN